MIDPMRHLEVFSPDKFNPTPVHIIGAGATGSKIAMSLAKLGIEEIHVWDADEVEPHNVANQLYGNHHIGQPKVEALADMVFRHTGITLTVHKEMVKDKQDFAGIVYLLVDTMKDRKEIFEHSLKNNFKVQLVIETRMGANSLRIYSFTPFRPSEIKGWESTLYTDDEAEVSACGASTTVGATADLVSGCAVWQLIKWAKQEQKPENELLMATDPPALHFFQFQTV